MIIHLLFGFSPGCRLLMTHHLAFSAIPTRVRHYANRIGAAKVQVKVPLREEQNICQLKSNS